MELHSIDLIELLETAEFAELSAGFRLRKFPAGGQVCAPGEASDRILLLKSGRLRVFLSCEGREFTLATLEPGDLYSSHTRAIVEAMVPSEVLSCSTGTFARNVQKHPEISAAMIKVLGELLKSSMAIIEGFAFKDVRQRLVEALLRMAQERGRSTPEGVRVELGMTMEELARMVGTSRQTLSTLLNELIRDGLVTKPTRRSLLFPDLAQLRNPKGGQSVS